MNVIGKYLQNSTSQPLPIYLAGKATPYRYFQPGDNLGVQIAAETIHDDGAIFGQFFPLGKDKPASYVLIGKKTPDNVNVYFVKAFGSGADAYDKPHPFAWGNVAKFGVIGIVISALLFGGAKAFRK